jgi:hypothetical protein
MRTLLVIALLGACTGSPTQDALDDARAAWDDEGQASYRFTWRQGCECIPEATRPIRIEVENDQIVAATYVDGGQPVPSNVRMYLLTVDGIFDEIQSAIDEDAHRITVDYDPVAGFPRTVAIDYDKLTADEELSLAIQDVEPPLPAAR